MMLQDRDAICSVGGHSEAGASRPTRAVRLDGSDARRSSKRAPSRATPRRRLQHSPMASLKIFDRVEGKREVGSERRRHGAHDVHVPRIRRNDERDGRVHES